MFRFKQFAIRQENAAMKVGTDGALIGAWSDLSNAHSILDIGTGTAIIAMMCAQRHPFAQITGIEIDEYALLDAHFNVKQCPWTERINILHTSLQQFEPQQSFDVIISNPPFFENSLKSISYSKKTARHTDSLHFSDILNFAQRHLSKEGTINMILPVENAKKCIDIAIESGFYLTRKCTVRPVPHKEPHRLVFELSRIQTPFIEEQLTIETGKRHDYTEDYIALTNAFYTIM